MNTRQSPAIIARTTSLLASLAVTAVIIGSQLIIADHYTRQADALLAAKHAQQPVALQPAAMPQPRS